MGISKWAFGGLSAPNHLFALGHGLIHTQPKNQHHDEDRCKNVEQNFGDIRSAGSDASETKDGGNYGNDEKNQRPLEESHGSFFLEK